jgi:hypothetical protein
MSDDNMPESPKKKLGRPAKVVEDMRPEPAGETREEMRASKREEDPRARAERRAAEIRQNLKGDISDGADRFYIDPRMIPDGWSYEWKRKSLWGKEDPGHEVELARQGWEAVPASRHPQMMPSGNWQTIDRDGMILMERPKVLTDDVHKDNLRKARLQVRAKEAQLNQAPEGTFDRDDPRVKPNIKKSFEAMPISESE